ncbi:MAG: hypothetical protein AAF211_19345, partial [Myxococcota bacterium]
LKDRLMSSDALFRPTVAQTMRRPGTPKPWYVASQFWLAFFGGMFALAAIAFLNTYRLAMRGSDRVWVVVWTVLVFAGVSLAVGAWVGAGNEMPSRTTLRIVYRGGALILYGLLARLQRTGARRYDYLASSDEEDYASLWVPGVLAAMVGGAVQGFVIASLVVVPLESPELVPWLGVE